MNELINEIIAELTIELEGQPTFNAKILSVKVKDAYRKVRSYKHYENTTYDEDRINRDLRERYYQNIKELALYYFAKKGADFETSHSENSISRTWRTEAEILGDITAFVGRL